MNTPSLRELYKDPNIRQSFDDKDDYQYPPLEEILLSLDAMSAYPEPSHYLDNLHSFDNDDLRYEASRAVGYLPPAVIMEHYGEEVLAWAALNAPEPKVREEHQEALERFAVYDTGLFQKAQRWCAEYRESSKVRDVLLQYDVMETVVYGGLEDVELSDVIKDSAKPEVTIKEGRASNYSLIPMQVEEDPTQPNRVDGRAKDWYHVEAEPNVMYNIWLDAPSGFSLAYKGRPNAIVAVAAYDDNELMIHQLQGVRAEIIEPNPHYEGEVDVIGRKSSRDLMPLDWHKCMVDIAAKLAVRLSMYKLGIQGAQHNIWTRALDSKGAPRLSHENAEKAYDVPAQRLGFSYGEDGNWHKLLATAEGNTLEP